MTLSQIKFYRARWAKVKKVLVEMAGMSAAEAEEERYEITREALGVNKSSKDFTQRDLDRVLQAFDGYLVLIDGPSSSPQREVAQPLARLIWTIEKTGLNDAYISKISQDKFGTADWRTMPERRLRFLCWTCVARAGKKAGA
jgi:hypothetical protein